MPLMLSSPEAVLLGGGGGGCSSSGGGGRCGCGGCCSDCGGDGGSICLHGGASASTRGGISLTAPQWRALLARGADLSAALDTLEAELAAGKAAAGTAAAASAGGQGDIDGVGDEP